MFYRKYDYIANPKQDGYRGVHLVYEYRSEYENRAQYSGQRIEVQIRSKPQHVWATAVETVDAFSEQALKSGIGNESWKRLFALMGSYIALLESGPFAGTDLPWPRVGEGVYLPGVPDTPKDWHDLLIELDDLSTRLNVIDTLANLAVGVETIKEFKPKLLGAPYYLLVFDPDTDESYVLGFWDILEASAKYNDLERENRPGVQVVLASADSVSTLRKAYPNYFHDTAAFMSYLQMLHASRERVEHLVAEGIDPAHWSE